MQYTGHPSSIPGWRRTPGGRNGKPLQYSGLEKAMERGDSQATAHWAKKSQKWQWLSTMHTHPTESPCVHLELTQEFKSALNSVTQSCSTLCDPMNCSMSGLPVHHQLLEFTQTHVHRVGGAIQPSHPLSSHSPAPNPSQLTLWKKSYDQPR